MGTLVPSQGGEIDLARVKSDEQLLIERWLHGKAKRTQEEYRRDVGQFLAFAGKPLIVCTLDDLQGWEDELGVEIMQSSVRRKMAAIKSILRFAHETGLFRFNVGVAYKLPKIRRTLADRILTDDEVQRMIRYEPNRRNRLILRTLYTTGMRASELCALTWRDLRRQKRGGQINIFGKGSKSRAVWIPDDLFETLVAYRGRAKPTEPMFRSQKGGHLTKCRIWQIVRRAAESVGVEGDVSPHFLRHTHASEAIANGAPINLVAATLGHSSVATTTAYLHARPEESSAKYLPTAERKEAA